MKKEAIETFCPTSRTDWREWLVQNHDTKQNIWLVYYKKKCERVKPFMVGSR